MEPLRRCGTAVQHLTVGSERIGAFPEGIVPPTEAGSLPLGSLTALRGIRDGGRVSRRIGAIVAGHKATEFTELAQLVDAGILRLMVDSTYAVTDLARAHEEFGKGGNRGLASDPPHDAVTRPGRGGDPLHSYIGADQLPALWDAAHSS